MAESILHKVGILVEFNGKKAEAGLNRMERSFNQFKRVIVTVLGGKMIKEVANFGKEISLMADRTGMSIEKLSALRNVFISAGSGAKGFQATVDKINQGLLGLNRGEGQLAGVLAPLGISPFGKDAEQLIYEIADAAKEQLGIGRSKAEVLDYLTNVIGIDPYMAEQMLGGSQALLSERARLAERVGTLNKESVENLKDFNKSLNDLSATWENFKVNVLGKLVVVLQPIVEITTDLLSILSQYPEVGAMVVGVMGSLLSIMSAMSALRFAGSLFGIGGAAAGAGAAGTAGAVGGASFAVGAALIAAIGESLREIFNWAKTGEMKGIIFDFWEWYFDYWGKVFDWFSNMRETGSNWLRSKWDDIKEWAIGVFANARANIGTAYNSTDIFTKENASGRTKSLFGYTTDKDMIIFTEPVAADSEFLNSTQSAGMSIVNHFEGSTFGSDLEETEQAINESMSTVLSNAVPAM